MPELPEVETIRTGLSALLIGKRIVKVDCVWPKSFLSSESDVADFLIGAKITKIRRRGKILLIDLNTSYSLMVHLKMTGQLVYRGEDEVFGAGHPTDSLIGELPDKSTRITLNFADSGRLFFNDQRKFGWMRLVPVVEIPNIDFFKKIGPEPLSAGFSKQKFCDRVGHRPKSKIKAVLLDQTVVAGIGNIYADESLWGAKIHPSTIVNSLSTSQLNRLYDEMRYILTMAIEKGGSTDKNYVNAEGRRGSYLDFARVFRRGGQSCARCGETIIKIRVAGRGTHVCPRCQKEHE